MFTTKFSTLPTGRSAFSISNLTTAVELVGGFHFLLNNYFFNLSLTCPFVELQY